MFPSSPTLLQFSFGICGHELPVLRIRRLGKPRGPRAGGTEPGTKRTPPKRKNINDQNGHINRTKRSRGAQNADFMRENPLCESVGKLHLKCKSKSLFQRVDEEANVVPHGPRGLLTFEKELVFHDHSTNHLNMARSVTQLCTQGKNKVLNKKWKQSFTLPTNMYE